MSVPLGIMCWTILIPYLAHRAGSGTECKCFSLGFPHSGVYGKMVAGVLNLAITCDHTRTLVRMGVAMSGCALGPLKTKLLSAA